MGLFDRDRMYGGLRLDEEFPLMDVRREASRDGKLKSQSDEFIIWDCLGVIATDIPTSIGRADKVGFTVSSMDDPATRKDVGTFASAIRDMVAYALDNAREELGKRDASFEELARIAFSDLPAIARLQRVESRIETGADALVLTFVSDLRSHPDAARIADAVKRAARAARKVDFGDDIPF